MRDKLATLARLPTPWLVCIDETLAPEPAQQIARLPGVFKFKRKIDVGAFLRHIEEVLARRLISNDR